MLPLPKVARVVTSFGQNPSIRNAFHLQSSPSSSTKTSTPGSNYFHQNKGSSKPLYNYFDHSSSGSKGKFTHGYLGATRAVTQIQPVISSDTGNIQSDDYEEAVTPKPVTSFQRRRYRSRSLSYTSKEGAQKLGVLFTVQIHARSRHAFSQALTTDDIVPEALESPASPRLTRRNSTASVTRPDTSLDTLPPLPPSPPPFSAQIDTTLTASIPSTYQESEHYRAFVHARSSGDHEFALLAVNNFRTALVANTVIPHIVDFNAAIEALYFTRPHGSPLTDIQGLYNTMIRLGLPPNARTYTILVCAHCDRDYEVVWALNGIEERRKTRRIQKLSEALSLDDQNRKVALTKENNFSSAVSLFQILRTLHSKEMIPVQLFSRLLRCCGHYGAIDSAIMVWETIEEHISKPHAVLYKYMLQSFGRAGEIDAAEDVFTDFRERSLAGNVTWSSEEGSPEVPARSSLYVWNAMIEAYFKCGKPDMAVSLLEEMLQSGLALNEGGQMFTLPSPAPSTYTTIIAGFCHSSDYQSAISWFNTLITQSSSPGYPFDPTPLASRPDTLAWRVLIETLSQQMDTLSELNTVWSTLLDYAVRDGIQIRVSDRCLVANSNLEAIQSLKAIEGHTLSEESFKQCSELLEVVKSTVTIEESFIPSYTARIWKTSLDLGLPIQCVEHGLWLFEGLVTYKSNSSVFHNLLGQFSRLMCAQDWEKITSGPVALGYALRLHELYQNESSQVRLHPFLMEQYYYARSQSLSFASLSPAHVNALCLAAAGSEMLGPQGRSQSKYQFTGFLPFLEDLVREAGTMAVSTLQPQVKNRMFEALLYDRSVYQVQALLEELGLMAEFSEILDKIKPSSSSDASQSPTLSTDSDVNGELTTPVTSVSSHDFSLQPPAALLQVESRHIPGQLSIDRDLTRHIDASVLANLRSPGQIKSVWSAFQRGLNQGRVPAPFTLSRFCQALGRAKDVTKVKQVYATAQSLLATMENDKQVQSDSWFLIEDGMIIALAQAGEVDAAHVHRQRILDQGGAPSADAYGGLILNVKDTTDDTSNAMALFNESQMLGVVPNHYLYNNIISKLAKARKADAALDLFARMKASSISPSSITFGAVIGACARVGDAVSAEALYVEMVEAPTFKPRIPPFNTMMQLYTTTKPNRNRALFFYEEILRNRVMPTSYTYKLLMEAYVLEPLDIPKMEQVFQELVDNSRLELQGTHFATLINAYGCVAKDLDKALAVYNSIFDHPRKPTVDALVFEAIANVCVAHRRIDLMPRFVSRMNDVGVHMTAYIVNVMIKGYAAVGDIENSRELFERLVDPPEGIAALHNHAPHDPSSIPSVSPMEPVYREPSTWEAMVRAELGSGTRDRAIGLIERLESRRYPEAVVNRIKNIMIDHSQLLPYPN